MKEKNIDRRDFLKKSALTIAAGTVAFSAIDISKLIAAAGNSEDTEDTTEKVINLSDYPALQSTGGYAMITDKIIVIRTSSSNFVTLNITCTHKKCDVEFDGSGFECPCHGSEYNKTGKVLNGPATKNLRSYKTTYNSDNNTITIKM